MLKCTDKSLGWIPYYEGRNEIYEKAGRTPVYSYEKINKEKIRKI